jgi:hypothetical protein
MSLEEAERYRSAFFQTYPGIARWHQRIRRERATETRTLAGRRVLVEADGFFGGKANYAVQGTGGDGIKLALALLWERRDQVPGAFPVLVVHDEIVVECDQDQADAVAGWLRQAMLDGMAPLIEPVPVEVEVKIGQTWGGANMQHRRPRLQPVPLDGVLPLRAGISYATMSEGQWDGLLHGLYDSGFVLLELDDDERPRAAYRKGGLPVGPAPSAS